MQRDRLDDAVALVEDAEDCDPLRHRSHRLGGGGRPVPRALRRGRILLFAPLAARSQRERDQQRCGDSLHAYSGIHGS
jgi:hypothetical protein